MYNLKTIIMSENVENQGAAKRPAFLTVLCILSFIAAGISIVGLAIGAAAKGVVESAGGTTDLGDLGNLQGMEGMEGMGEAQVALDQASAAFSWPSMIGAILLTIIGLVGVIKMWKLQKQGYYIYTGAAVVGLILPVVLGAGFSVFSLIITAAFVVMYGLNLKHMN
jgi:hypothetical protein